MKKICMRLTSMVLAIVSAFSLNCTVFAVDDATMTTGAMIERAIATEIQAEKNRAYETIMEQLEAQNAPGHFEIYKAIIDTQIENNVYEKYGLSPVSATSVNSTTYSGFTYGGSIGYEGPIGDAVCLTTVLDFKNSYYYILGGSSSITVKDIIIEVGASLGSAALPMGWGAVYGLLCTLKTFVSQAAKDSVREQGGYAMIISVDSNLEGSSSVLLGWSGYATHTVTVPDGISNVKICYFPEHDPFA